LALRLFHYHRGTDREAPRDECTRTLKVLRSGTGSLPKPLVFSFGGLGSGLGEQVARDVDQGEPSSFFWQFIGVGFDEYFDRFVAGMNFDTQRAALEIDFVTPSRLPRIIAWAICVPTRG
jgi:hypothetical protein